MSIDVYVRPGTVERIKRITCVEYGIHKEQIESNRRLTKVVTPRWVAMALARRLTNLSFTSIGNRFGGRDHSTVWWACKRMQPYVEAVADNLPPSAPPEAWVRALQDVMEADK